MVKTSIIEYLGKVENGILTLVSLVINNKYYECTFFYNEKDIILTIPDELESEIGDIKLRPEYPSILKDILTRIVPYSEMIERIDDVDFSRWIKK